MKTVNRRHPQTHWHTFQSLNSVCEVQKFSVGQYKYHFDGLFVSLPWAVSVGLYMFLSVAVCEFPLLQRLPVAPETLTDTRQVFPLSRHILSTCWSPAKKVLQRQTQEGNVIVVFVVVVVVWWVAGVIIWMWLLLSSCPKLERGSFL